MKEIDAALLEILVCPKCRGDLTHEANPPRLVCTTCMLAYQIREGIPVLLMDQAEPVAGSEG